MPTKKTAHDPTVPPAGASASSGSASSSGDASGTTASGGAAPGTTGSGTAASGGAAPGTTGSGTAASGGAAPGTTGSGTAASGGAAPGTTGSGTAASGGAAPGTTGSGTTASGGAAPGTTADDKGHDGDSTVYGATAARKEHCCEDVEPFENFRPRMGCVEPSSRPGFRVLPDFPALGIVRENICVCAELVYIDHYSMAIEAVENLAREHSYGRIPLDCDVGDAIDEYNVRRPEFLSDEERRRVTRRVVDGVMPIVEDLYTSLLEVYRASSLLGYQEAAVSPAPLAAVLWLVESAQRELSRLGAGIGAYVARRAGRQLDLCFRILNSPDLPRFIGIPYDDGMPGVIDRLRSIGPGKSPGLEAYKLARSAVVSRSAILALADLDELDELTLAELDPLAAQLALLFAISGRDEIHREEQLGDEGAERATELLRLARRNARNNPFAA